MTAYFHRQRKPRLVEYLVVLLLAVADPVPAGQTGLDGWWQSQGYGRVLHVESGSIDQYELTAVSCLPSTDELEISGSEPDGSMLLRVEGDDAGARLIPESDGQVRFRPVWAASDVVFNRIPGRPPLCGQPVENTAVSNFDVFWTTYREHYPFFEMKGIDWPGLRDSIRPGLSAATSDDELFRIFSDMIAPLQDAHTGIRSESPPRVFRGVRNDPNLDFDLSLSESRERLEKIFEQARELIESRYIEGGLQSYCKGHLQFGQLPGGLIYLRVDQEYGYSDSPLFAWEMQTMEAALDAVFTAAANARGVILDVRKNYGGSDLLSLALASRLTAKDYLAYEKVARSDPQNPAARTPGQPRYVVASDRPGFHGPVVQLIGPYTISAGETMTQALLGREPAIIRVGENTQGVFSDTLGRVLPNGWTFWLANEMFLTKNGRYFDGPGIQPDVRVPVFRAEDIEGGRDPALEEAIRILGSAESG